MNEQQNNNFIDSLEQLTVEDLAPQNEVKRPISNPISRILWLLVAILLLGVAIWSSSQVVGNVMDFIKAEQNYDGMAGQFSPITGIFDRPAILRPGKDSYPLPNFDEMLAGEVSYPDDDEPTDLPVVNPGTDPSPLPPSLDESTLPSDLSLARHLSSPTGTFLSPSTFIISWPTAPVAPITPTLYFFIDRSSLYLAKLS